jgi:polyhydroxybutyrate depolymerase
MATALCTGALSGGAGRAAASTAGVPTRPSSGRSVRTAAPPGTTNQLLAAGGDNGGYVRQIPPTYNGRSALPLVINLHGYAESAAVQVTLTALGTYGDHHGFITITPQVAGPVPMWNAGLHSHDMAFIGALLRTVDATLCIDRNRTYVTGYSDGAFMASSVACRFAGQIAAFAPVAGLRNPAGCHPARRIPVLTIHGTADTFVAYKGGLGSSALTLPAPDGSSKTLGQEIGKNSALTKGPSIPSITAAWARRDGCAAHPRLTEVASDVTRIAYRCPTGDQVVLYRVQGGGHAWPGSVLSKNITSIIGKVTFSISANTLIWSFFRSHPLHAPTS